METKPAAKQRPMAIRSRIPPTSAANALYPQPAAIKQQKSSAFNFFALARELRDAIYEASLVYKKKLRNQNGARVRGRNVIDESLLTISKQFRREYMELAARRSCLVITDRPEFHGYLIKLPPALTYVRKLELYLAIACDAPDHFGEQCRVLKECRMHRKWIADLCKNMRHLDSLRVDLVVDPHQYISTCQNSLVDLLWKFTGVEELTQLNVWHCDYAGKDFGWNFAKKRSLALRWEARDGVLREFEVPKAENKEAKDVEGEAAT